MLYIYIYMYVYIYIYIYIYTQYTHTLYISNILILIIYEFIEISKLLGWSLFLTFNTFCIKNIY